MEYLTVETIKNLEEEKPDDKTIKTTSLSGKESLNNNKNIKQNLLNLLKQTYVSIFLNFHLLKKSVKLSLLN